MFTTTNAILLSGNEHSNTVFSNMTKYNDVSLCYFTKIQFQTMFSYGYKKAVKHRLSRDQ